MKPSRAEVARIADRIGPDLFEERRGGWSEYHRKWVLKGKLDLESLIERVLQEYRP